MCGGHMWPLVFFLVLRFVIAWQAGFVNVFEWRLGCIAHCLQLALCHVTPNYTVPM